jgi:hypothetical protein
MQCSLTVLNLSGNFIADNLKTNYGPKTSSRLLSLFPDVSLQIPKHLLTEYFSLVAIHKPKVPWSTLRSLQYHS